MCLHWQTEVTNIVDFTVEILADIVVHGVGEVQTVDVHTET